MQIYNKIISFRCPNTLAESLNEVASYANRHASDIIREAVFQYVKVCQQKPDHSKRWN